MKIYVGIDIAKLNHFAAAISSDGEIIIEPFKFTMTLMASNCWSLNSNLSVRTATSSVLSQRHTTVTTLFVTLLLSFTKCVC